MLTEREMVEAFHRAMELPVREHPEMPSDAERLLRCRLLLEEVEEFIAASGCYIGISSDGQRFVGVDPRVKPDLVAMAHENADVRVITHGTDLYMGSPHAVLGEVMAANRSKLGADGRPVLRADGKIMKGPNYRPPDVAGILAAASTTPVVSTSPVDAGDTQKSTLKEKP